MGIHERIKSLRKNVLKLTQEEFSDKLKISRSNLANIEVERINITNRVIADICCEFKVNEHWLRTGEGEIFAESKERILSKLSNILQLDDIEQKFLSAYIQLDQEQRQNIKEFCRQLAKVYKQQEETVATLFTRPVNSDENLTCKQKQDLIIRELELEDKAKKEAELSASITINGIIEKRA